MVVEGDIVGEGLKGRVKWFSNSKGFGFLVGEGVEGDIFVHYSSITGDGFKTLKENQLVQYTLVKTTRGPQASDVVKL